jgi:hypothetical protein
MKSHLHRHQRYAEGLLEELGRPLHSLPGLAHRLLSGAEHLAPLLLAAVLAFAVAALVIARARRRRLARGARLVRIGVPPEVDADGGALLWSALHDLIRPRLARLVSGQPHIAWEISSSESGTSFGLWVPEIIPPGIVERALAAAWPGASVTNQEGDSGICQGNRGSCRTRDSR